VLDKYENKTKADPPFVYILEWEGPTSKQKFSRIDHLSKQSSENNARKQKGLPSVRVCHPLHLLFFFHQNRGKIKQLCRQLGKKRAEKQMRFLSTSSQLGRKIEREGAPGKRETKFFFSADKLVFAFLICLPWSVASTLILHVHSSAA
jgi:hypothetical protein